MKKLFDFRHLLLDDRNYLEHRFGHGRIDLLAARESPMRILYLIVRQFRQMMVIQEMAQQRRDIKTIAKQVGMPDFAVRRNMGLCKNFTREQMYGLLRDAAEFDEEIKTGRIDDQMAVELLMMKYA